MRETASNPEQSTPEASAARVGFPDWAAALLLALLTVALYWPALRADFVNYDDPIYITSNPHIQAGLTWQGMKWAVLEPGTRFGYWHPVTLLSHMLDCQLYGLKPWGHHLTSVLLHAFNTVLVFLFLRRLTGAFWRSLAVAALFGAHPLHVESVAWVSERKDVLCAFFGLLTLIFYARYVDQLKIKNAKCKISYGLALAFFALGLLSKPMLVTWPFVMLLLDYWPLYRGAKCKVRGANANQPSTINHPLSTPWQLVLEKTPFFALVAIMSGVTFMLSKKGGMMAHGAHLSAGARIANALVSYCRYLGKMFWPARLAVLYPHPGQWPLVEVLAAGGILLVLSLVFFRQRRRYPFVLMGWLWFVGMLVPVIGLVQIGEFAMADRYAYLPSLGLFIAVVWGGCELTRHWQQGLTAGLVMSTAATVACMAMTWHQLGYWHDSEALFRHTLEVTENNPIAHNNLGTALYVAGSNDEAIAELTEALRLRPTFAFAHNNLGLALAKKGRTDEAIDHYQQAISINPAYAAAHENLGLALCAKKRVDDAISQYHEALQLEPDNAAVHYDLGIALADQGRNDEATAEFAEANRLNPDRPAVRNSLGTELYKNGKVGKAITEYQQALQATPDDAELHKNLGMALAKNGRVDEAISQFREAIRLQPADADTHNNLGKVLGRTGRIEGAIQEFQAAIRLKPDSADSHNDLGIAFVRSGKVDEAIKEFQEAVRLQPDFSAARDNLSRALVMKNAPPGR